MNVILRTNYSVVNLTFGSSINVTYSICRSEFKREGSGRGNWGTQTDELAP